MYMYNTCRRYVHLCPMGMNLDAGAHPGPMGALKPPRVAPPAYLRPRARRWSGGAAHSNLVHVAGWLVVALLLLAFGLSVLAACLPLGSWPAAWSLPCSLRPSVTRSRWSASHQAFTPLPWYLLPPPLLAMRGLLVRSCLD